jgi:hypothetical protein
MGRGHPYGAREDRMSGARIEGVALRKAPTFGARQREAPGLTLATAIDLAEIRHKPMPARSPRGHQPVIDVIARCAGCALLGPGLFLIQTPSVCLGGFEWECITEYHIVRSEHLIQSFTPL